MMDMFNGIPIIESVHCPVEENVMKLSNDVTVSSNFRHEFDVWLGEFFVFNEVVLQTQVGFIIHPSTRRKLEM